MGFDKELFSYYAKERKKESGESIEIALFGRRIRELTIKEALFIIEPSNYIKGLKSFTKNFNMCNKKDNLQIITPQTKSILMHLGINVDELPNDSKKKFKMSHYANLDNSSITFENEVTHPPGFYFGKLDKNDYEKILNGLDLMQKDFEPKK